MTIINQVPIVNHEANGVQDTFAYNFYIADEDDLKVYEDNVLTALAYTVTGVGVETGGNIVYTTAVPADEVTVTLRREVDYKQSTDYTPYGPFPASVHEVALDKLAMQIQQLKEMFGRTAKASITSDFDDELGIVPIANAVIGFNADGDGFTTHVDLGTTSISVFMLSLLEITTAALCLAAMLDGACTRTELTYLSGVTSALQAQLDSKRALNAYIKVSDVKATTVNGGTFTSGAWQTRDINTEDFDPASLCALGSNQITLEAGTYECRISVPAYYVQSHKAKLVNVTGSVDLLLGTVEFTAATNNQTRSFISGRFTIAASQALEIQHRCAVTCATAGFGCSSSFGEDEVYTIAEFWKVG